MKKTQILGAALITALLVFTLAVLSLTGCENDATGNLSNEKAITAFAFTSLAVTGTINETAKTVSVTVPYETNVSSLTPTVTHTGVSYSPGGAQNFSNPVTYTVRAENGSTQAYVVTVIVGPNNAKAITAFAFENPAATGIIDEEAKTISVIVPYGTDVTELMPVVAHTGVSYSPIVAQDFSNPVTYTVTAADNSTQEYVVTVAVATNDSKAITAFTFTSPVATGIIDEEAKTISVTVPYGTVVTDLTPVIAHTGVSISPDNEPQNFTNPVSYTVTAFDNSSQAYVVTVTVVLNDAKAITAFSFDSPAATGTIDETEKTISVHLPFGTDVTSLTPSIIHTGISISPDNEPQDFTDAVTYTVRAADDTMQEYVVTVTVALNDAKAITDFAFTSPAVTGTIDETEKTISVTVPFGTNVTSLKPVVVHTGASISPDNESQNFTNAVTYTVTAENGSTQEYVITVKNAAPSDAKAITAFALTSPAATGIIDEAAKTISVVVPFGTNITSRWPAITHTGVSISPDVGWQDFSNQVTYTVTAQDGSTQEYVVTVVIDGIQSVQALTAYLSSLPANNSADNPYFVPMSASFDLGNMGAGSNWPALYNALNAARRFVELDLSACTMTGTVFDPDTITASSGKGYIVSLVLPDEARSIPNGTSEYIPRFYNFNNLKSVSGAGVTTIGNYAFSEAHSYNAGQNHLISADFPLATSIGVDAFLYCTNLKNVNFPVLESVGNSAFRQCRSLTSVSFPAVTSIGNAAFQNTGLTSVTGASFPSAITIGNDAFMNCTSLTNVSFPAVISIGSSAFANTGLTSVASVDFPVAISIGERAFIGSTGNWQTGFAPEPSYNLTSVSFPAVTSIGNEAFSNCRSLASADFPSVITIGNEAFRNNTSLSSATIPDSVTTIGDGAFQNTELTEITIPNSVTTIGNSAFQGCTSLTSVTLPNNPNFTTISNNTFQNTGLTEITIPNSVTTIGNSAFNGCRILTSITLPDSVTTIGNIAFQNTGLTEITIPNSVTTIGTYAFNGCTSLESVNIYAETPPALANINAFTNTNNCPIYVPANSVDDYKAAPNWNAYESRIQAIP